MKPKTEPSLDQLRKEIEELKKEKTRKLQIATSMTERNKLLREINQLNAVQKSSSALRNFGKTFGKGLSMIGGTLWKGITKASRNIDTNAPEVREFGKTMTYQPKSSREPPTDLDKMFLPKPKPYIRPRQPKKTTKKNKSKKRRKKARKMVYNQPKQSANSWELP